MNKTAVVAWGRANPPSIGHEKLFDKTIEHAKQINGHPHIYVSHTQDKKKNPLTSAEKVNLIKKSYRNFKNLKVNSSSKESPGILHIASKLHSAGYHHLHMVAGSDRVEEYHKLLNNYNGKEGPHGKYNFKSIKVISAGHRDPDAAGVEGISASKLRSHAISGNKEEFKKGMMSGLSDEDKENVFNRVRSSLKEDFNNNCRFDDGDPKGTLYMLSMTPGIKNITCPKNEKWDNEKGKCVPSLEKIKEIKIPYLLMSDKQKQALLEEHNQLNFDGYNTKNFDICPEAFKIFQKNIKDLNNLVINRPSFNKTNFTNMSFKNYLDLDQ
jgi:acyl-CoA-binding protein